MSQLSNTSIQTILIYIPCHKDFEMAFANARRLKTQHSLLLEKKLAIKIVVSINGVVEFPMPEDLSDLHIYHIQEVLGADGNILKGFVSALESRPDYFWILSANEELTPDAVRNIQEMIQQDTDADLFIANAANRSGRLRIQNIFTDMPKLLAIGLISGVIYKFHSTKSSYLQSSLFSWTGWGHLAVIQDFLSKNKNAKLIEFPDSQVYQKPFTFSPDAEVELTERTIVSNLYSHSFFGLPVLAYCLLQVNPKLLKRFQIDWLLRNWFKINLFSSDATFGDELALKRSKWIKKIAEDSFKTFKVIQFCYFMSSHIPIDKLQHNKTAIRLLSFYKGKT